MDEPLRELVRRRANNACEYCRLQQEAYPPRFHIEHIRARSHGGGDDDGNLALACPWCNRNKGPNLSAYDPATGAIVPLFNPRTNRWQAHFAFRGEQIEGVTEIGRATVALLRMNDEPRLMLRRSMVWRSPDEPSS